MLFKDHPEVLVSLMRQTDPSTVAEHGIFTRAAESYPEQRWGRGRVTLVGDAAHPVRPTGRVPDFPLLSHIPRGWPGMLSHTRSSGGAGAASHS